MDEISIRQRLALAQELKARGNCAAGVRTYVMDVESLLAKIERLQALVTKQKEYVGDAAELKILADQQAAEIERLKKQVGDSRIYAQDRDYAAKEYHKQVTQLEFMAETYRVKLAKLCDVVTCYASAGNIEVYYHENLKSPCLSDAMDDARKALEEEK